MNEHLWITNIFLIAIGTGSSETISGKSILSFHIPVHRYNKHIPSKNSNSKLKYVSQNFHS